MKPLVSIIVPIYKVEAYLNRCVTSIINQTYKNLEIFLVDDGSPDCCPQICDEWAKKDDRIIVIHKDNGGLSDARNQALDVATGDYVFFVDSDDMIALNAVEILIQVAEKENSDMVISRRYHAFSKEMESENTELKGYHTVDAMQGLEMMFCETMRWEAWGTLYRRELFYGIRYPYGKIYEDISTTPRVMLRTKKVTYIHALIYYYFIRDDSIMRKNNTVVRIDLYDAVNDIVGVFKSIKNSSVRNNVIAGILEELVSRVHLSYQSRKENEEFIDKSRALVLHNLRYILKADKLTLKRKLFIILVLLNLSPIVEKRG